MMADKQLPIPSQASHGIYLPRRMYSGGIFPKTVKNAWVRPPEKAIRW